MLFNYSDAFDEYIFNFIDIGFGSPLVWGIFFIILGFIIILICTYFILKCNNKSNAMLNDVIAQEVINSNKEIYDNNDSVIDFNDIPNVIIDESITYSNNESFVSSIENKEIPDINITSNIIEDEFQNKVINPVIIEEENEEKNLDNDATQMLNNNYLDSIIYEDVSTEHDIDEKNEILDSNIDINDIKIVDISDGQKDIDNNVEPDNVNEFIEIDDFKNEKELIKESDYFDKTNYHEIEDVPEVIANKDINVLYPHEVNVNIERPIKGKDIDSSISLKDEEEIELL